MLNNGLKQLPEKASLSLSVTKIRVAFECARLFYLKHSFGGNTVFIPANTAIGIGNIFHQFADEFVRLAIQEVRFKALFKPAAADLIVEEIASQMQQLFFDLKFLPVLEEVVKKEPKQAPVLLQVWQGLQGLIKRFSELLVVNRRYCSEEAVIPKTFVPEEHRIEHYFNLPDGSRQRVVGEFDCLIFNFELQRLCVVEFKTYQPIDPSAQLAQVALYSYMLWAKKKVPVDSAVYCVLPEFKEYHYSWEQLENTVHQLVPHKLQQMQQWLTWEAPRPNSPPPTSQPHLCDICPQRKKCQSFFTLGEKIVSNSSSSDSTTNADSIGKELIATLKSFGIGVDYQGAAVGPAFIRVKLKPHAGVKVSSILKLSNDLQVQLGLADSPLIAPQAGYISVDLPRLDRQVASFEQYIQPQSLAPTAAVRIAIGVNLEGQLVEADLSDPNTCHFLVGGTTGSGKSEFLRSLLLSLLVRHSAL